jgi:glycogen debranching enzyme
MTHAYERSHPSLGLTAANLWSEYEIESHNSLTDRPLRTLKHGDAFAVLDIYGDFGSLPDTAEGLFYRDTRYLSQYELRIEGRRPLLLSSFMHEDKTALTVDLTNPDLLLENNQKLPRDTIFLERTKFIWKAVCYERIQIKNFDRLPRRFHVDVLFAADFKDLFQVRGTTRPRQGHHAVQPDSPCQTEFHYRGLDGVARRTALHFSPTPERLEANRATFDVQLGAGEQKTVIVKVACGEGTASSGDFFLAYRDTRRARRSATAGIATVTTSNRLFDEVMCRATSDVYTLITHTDLGPYPYAGIPWFSTVFGRDGLITAMFLLWADPSVARGVLRTLASTQATEFDPASDAQPGKILHERRRGEMANLGEVPFRAYYGTVDATPLFVLLAGMYFERTGDLETLAEIWPNVEAALLWIDKHGDRDGDGFVEYYRETESGLANQGWKDSWDSVFHADGTLAHGPIALCEVQAYVYAAKTAIAPLAVTLGHEELSRRLRREAETLRNKFEDAFWCERLGTYAIALDGAKRACEVRSSNAGHALFCGIADPSRALRTADTLTTPEAFSGWGIRTLAQGEARYNPMSYHNGSVWPHDNAMIGIGFARYGFKAEAARVFESLFSAAVHQESRRLPELFCGFLRRPHGAPTAYPVACSPQAWSAAASFGLFAACIGLEIAHEHNEIRFREPYMPPFLDEAVIRNLSLGGSRADVRLHRYGSDVSANVLSRHGPLRVAVLK